MYLYNVVTCFHIFVKYCFPNILKMKSYKLDVGQSVVIILGMICIKNIVILEGFNINFDENLNTLLPGTLLSYTKWNTYSSIPLSKSFLNNIRGDKRD